MHLNVIVCVCLWGMLQVLYVSFPKHISIIVGMDICQKLARVKNWTFGAIIWRDILEKFPGPVRNILIEQGGPTADLKWGLAGRSPPKKINL